MFLKVLILDIFLGNYRVEMPTVVSHLEDRHIREKLQQSMDVFYHDRIDGLFESPRNFESAGRRRIDDGRRRRRKAHRNCGF